MINGAKVRGRNSSECLALANAYGSVTSGPPIVLSVAASAVWSQNQVLGANVVDHPFAGVYWFNDLTISENVSVTSSNISHLVLKVNGTLTLGRGATIRVRNGYYSGLPDLPLVGFSNTVDLLNYGQAASGIRLFANAFGKGGNGGNGRGAYPVGNTLGGNSITFSGCGGGGGGYGGGLGNGGGMNNGGNGGSGGYASEDQGLYTIPITSSS